MECRDIQPSTADEHLARAEDFTGKVHEDFITSSVCTFPQTLFQVCMSRDKYTPKTNPRGIFISDAMFTLGCFITEFEMGTVKPERAWRSMAIVPYLSKGLVRSAIR